MSIKLTQSQSHSLPKNFKKVGDIFVSRHKHQRSSLNNLVSKGFLVKDATHEDLLGNVLSVTYRRIK